MNFGQVDGPTVRRAQFEAERARVKDKTAAQKHIRQGNAALDVGDVHAGITEFQSAMLILHRLNEQCPAIDHRMSDSNAASQTTNSRAT